MDSITGRRICRERACARVTPVLWFDTGEALDDPVEGWVLYNAQIVNVARKFTVGAGLSGRFLITEADLDWDERTVHDAGLFVNCNLGKWRPSVRLQVPLDEDVRDDLNPSLLVGMRLGAD